MDRDIARRIIIDFSEAAHQTYSQTYAYEAGYLQSVVLQLLERVPADVCFDYLQQFEKTTRELNQKRLISAIKEAA